MSKEILTTLESISKADVTATGNSRIGIAEAGIRHDMSRPPDLATQFQMAKDCGAFDYLDKTPPRAQLAEYARLSERFDLPVLAEGGGTRLVAMKACSPTICASEPNSVAWCTMFRS